MEMELPKQLQKQMEEVAEIERQLAGNQAAPEAGNTAEPEPEATPITPVVEEKQQSAAPVAPVTAEETWEQKFYTLQGKYAAEVPRLHAQTKELTAQLTELLQRKSVEQAPVQEEPPSLVTDGDVETFGKDLVDMARRAAREEAERAVRKFDRKVDEQMQPVKDRLEQSETQRFWSTVKIAIPNFDAIDANPKWIEFLDSMIPGTRISYRDAATQAVQTRDADALIDMAKHWDSLVSPVQQVAPQNPPAAQSKAQAELQRQVAPTSRKSQELPTTSAQKTFTGKDFEYWNSPKRRHDSDAADVVQMQAELDKAVEEGRIQW